MKNKNTILDFLYSTSVISFAFVLFSQSLLAQERDLNSSQKSEKRGETFFGPQVEVLFPIFVGVGPQLVFHENFELSLLYGVTPNSFSSTIGSVTASLANNQNYKDIVEAAFQNNSQVRGQFQYNFANHLEGWKLGFAYSKITSSGKAGIDKVLQAATGADYTNLKNLLAALGRSSEVDLDAKLDLVELSFGYIWPLGESSRVQMTLGATRVVSNTIGIKTGLPSFEASAAGKSLISTTQNDIQSIVSDYGTSPVIGIDYSFFF